jgi:hypothetical protein
MTNTKNPNQHDASSTMANAIFAAAGKRLRMMLVDPNS